MRSRLLLFKLIKMDIIQNLKDYLVDYVRQAKNMNCPLDFKQIALINDFITSFETSIKK